MTVIFTITSVYFKSNKKKKDTRCWGWWPTESTAKKAINNNYGDMHECLYNYLVLERIPSHTLGCAQKEYKKIWYTWTGHWEAVKEPEWAKNTIGWGIG